MNKSSSIAAAGVLAVVVLAVVFLPYFVGMQLEQRLRARLQHAGGLPVSLRIVRYDRGFWHARVTVAMIYRGQRILLDSRILHGPLPTIGWARIDTRPRLSALSGTLEPYFTAAPLTVTTRVGFRDSWTVDLDSPPAARPIPQAGGGQITWGGLHAELNIAGGRGSLNLGLPSLIVATPQRQIDVERLSAHADAATALNRLTAASTRADHGADFSAWNSRFIIRAQKFTIADETHDFQLALRGEYTQNTRGAPDRTLAVSQTVKIAQALFDTVSDDGRSPTRIHDTQITLGLSGLNIAPLQSALQTLRAAGLHAAGPPTGTTCASSGALLGRVRRIVEQQLPRILSGQPRVTLDIPQIALPPGRMNARLAARLAPAAADANAALRLPMLLDRLAANAHLAISRPLMMSLLEQRYSRSKALLMLQTGLNEHLIRAKQAGFVSDLRYADRNLIVNERPGNRFLSALGLPDRR